MQGLARHAKLARHGQHAFATLNPLDRLQLEGKRILPALRFTASLQHRSSSSEYL